MKMIWYGVDLEWAYADLLSGIRRRTGCIHRSYDVLHDSLVRLALANEHGAVHEPQTYLRGIVRNALVDQFHDESRWVSFTEPDPDSDSDSTVAVREPAEVAPSAERLVDLKQRLIAMQQILDCLPARCRDIFWLFRIEGHTYREIAALRGISLRVVERQIAKALLAISAAREALMT